MPSRWNYFSSALPTQGHVVNAVTTALELKKAFVVKPMMISHVVEPLPRLDCLQPWFQLPAII
jgi:hypothetical protein